MSPVAEAIKELGGLVIGVATLVTSTVALVQAVKTKKLVNHRTDQLLEAVEQKGKYLGHQEAKVDSRADRKEVVELAKDVAVDAAVAAVAKKEEPK